jgi:phage terminase small subunit
MVAKAPATKDRLTTRQRALVEAYVANGGNLTKAAEEAGYAQGNSGRVTAWKAMKTAHVQQYLMQQTAQAFSTHAAMAVGKVASLAKAAKSEYVQLEAAKDILDRAGFKPIDRAQVQVAGDIRVSIDLG